MSDELGRFFDLSPDMLCIASFDGRFLKVNASWTRTLGLPEEALLAEPFVSFVHPDDVARTAAETERLATDPTPVVFSNRYRAADGTYRWIEWISTSDPERQVVYAVARDVTDTRRVEQELAQAREDAERASRAKSEFLSRMSHELRTPLNAILGFGQLLELAELREDDADSVQQILKAGRHLLDLINEVLDISRIEAGRIGLSIEPVAVDEVVGDSLQLVAPLAAVRGLTLHAPPGSGAFVLADRQRLKQVLLNLLSNGIKYNRDGGSVAVAAGPAPGRPDLLRISVSDTGLGIDTGDMERAFEPFDRLAASAGTEGTGLGLALSRGLVEAMSGTMGVQSVPGDGSTFWLELPLATNPLEGEAAQPAEPALPLPSGAARRTVLYVEDNLSNLKLVERVLASRASLRLISAMQGRLGVDLAREHRPDLVLLDLHLPDMSGEDLLRRLRSDRRTASIPVVVISADATPGRLERLLRAGAHAYLTKPLDVRQFIAVVDELLDAEPRV